MSQRKRESPNVEKQFMVKTKVCQRLLKEVSFYKEEVQENETKLSQMKNDNADPYDIKKFEEVLGESYMMVPDSGSRLKKSVADLSLYMDNHGDELDERGQWFLTAKYILGQNVAENKTAPDATIDDIAETNTSDLLDGEQF
mmetsp:Transcript_29222/g.28078  ORF Transcript_29222/g.28078 Transcript_29222/m.28078 type:complete len:142 (-) Transcript_29222:131-556(-)|eukprot:CAMPEP_0197840392 /NCGR_PEP_ID=MMETSP1437-20131217/45583_1 /TAXON_ID=49252 ORGANISM="Eucampia antarctica, Strain CCMP1452" /NCGR_SAMPLE_ID=MMETSP1437 /ASSEMBLY_ACC=CAM_ASM_001096 /LENGTH=141 /DNA_ID=CAMNT_0043449999 /DNA_START=177 /DNA_END=602 /DNA_ORIENTATION=-